MLNGWQCPYRRRDAWLKAIETSSAWSPKTKDPAVPAGSFVRMIKVEIYPRGDAHVPIGIAPLFGTCADEASRSPQGWAAGGAGGAGVVAGGVTGTDGAGAG